MNLLPLLATLGLIGCAVPQAGSDLPDAYSFPSRFDSEESASYTGQIARHLLIHDVKSYLDGLTHEIDTFTYTPAPGDVEADLDFFYEFDSVSAGALPHRFEPPLPAQQSTYAEVATGKNLADKLAGNDPVGQHRDWSRELVGFADTTPEDLFLTWCRTVDEQAARWVVGDYPQTAAGTRVPEVYVTPEGLDLQQLMQKFLLGAVAFSQGVDDYLDDDVDGKGLLADHTQPEEGKNYTALEHAWDEAFGYFGASRTYGAWSADEIIAGAQDVDQNGLIDLTSEVSWGHSVNAAKRDSGAILPTEFTSEAWEGFLAGRALLASRDGALSDADFATLQAHRDQAVLAWEKAIAATVVHYINDTLQDMGTMGTDEYDFGDHAKHWSELKGFALSPQFNPRSPLSASQFVELHERIGEKPVLEHEDATVAYAYADDLRAARALIGEAYGFDAANLGDEHGENGW